MDGNFLNASYGCTNPNWSNDGSQVSCYYGSDRTIRVYDPSTYQLIKTIQPSSANINANSAYWLPGDSEFLVAGYATGIYCSDGNIATGIWRVSINNAVTPLIEPDCAASHGSISYAVPSPDGQKVAYTSYNGLGQSIRIINIDGSNDQQLIAPNTDNIIGTTWSTNGLEIIASVSVQDSTAFTGVKSHIELINAASGNRTVVVQPNQSSDSMYPTSGKVSDNTAPDVTGAIVGGPNSAGWFKDNTTINWTATDPSPSSGTPTQPTATVVSTEGRDVKYTSSQSCDPYGNCASGTLAVSLYKTAPTISYQLSTPPNGSGWNKNNVVVSFSCTDNLSGIDNCSLPQTVTTESANTQVVGTATDYAGNSTTVTVRIKLDKTAPTVTNAAISGVITVPLVGVVLIGNTTNITASGRDSLSGVTAAEYYFDTDPGVGNATAATANDGSISANGVDVSGLHGVHTIYVRSKDVAGNWSTASSVSFRRL